MTQWRAAILASLITGSALASSLVLGSADTGVSPLALEQFSASISDEQTEISEGFAMRIARLNRVIAPTEADRLLAQQTLDLAVPIADQLGLPERAQLEEAAFRVLFPEEYAHLQEVLSPKASVASLELQRILANTNAMLNELGTEGIVTGRNKSLWGLYQKQQKKQLSLDEIHDRTALRVRVESVEDCYRVIAALHEAHTPVLGGFDNYVNTPKASGYQSLHTTVIPAGMNRPVEFQVRTHAMHDEAEHGDAAHWRYKLSA